MRKKLVATVLVLLLCIGFVQDANAAKGESLDASIKNFMKYVKKVDYSGIDKYVKSWYDNNILSDISQMPQLESQIKKANKKMTYKVVSKKVKGKKATVKIKIKYLDQSEFALSMLAEEMVDIVWTGTDTSTMNEEEYYKYVDGLAEHAQEESYKDTYKTKTLTLTFVKDKNNWKLKKMTEKIENILVDNFLKSYS